ncbi:MAG: hypothetical protein VR64_12345 [Desulfatitalea sp. BRH_c12]|nr:MAG: hypothetical protein VR64_12345 [Desulfatitalea sp. BRH_c12]
MIKRQHIKADALTICLIWVLLLLISTTAGADPPQEYDIDRMKEDLRGAVTFRDKFYDAAVAGNRMWMVGYYGAILHFNGDTSRFEKQQSGTNLPLFDVTFLDANIGYIVGKRGIVLKTRDGGKSWVTIRKEGEFNLFAAHFIDSDTGWAVGDFGTILHTSDGGATWEDMSLKEADVTFNGCHFWNAQKGLIAGEFESIYLTQDGGATWSAVSEQSMAGASLFDIHFKNADHALAVGQNGVFFQTSNGGFTWKRQKMGNEDNLLRIGVIDERYHVVGLRGVMIEESPDGVLVTNDGYRVSDWLNCLISFSSGAAIAAGDHGRVLWSNGSHSQRAWEIIN